LVRAAKIYLPQGAGYPSYATGLTIMHDGLWVVLDPFSTGTKLTGKKVKQ